jgi:nucleoside-diphosphate-sugar epimerase
MVGFSRFKVGVEGGTMNAAITGGAGFIGRALVGLAVPRFEVVRALVRRTEDEEIVRSLGAEPVRGDLTIPGACAGLAGSGDVVFHLAARVETRGSWSQFRRTTVEGTRLLLEAVLPQRPARFVYVSSGSVYSPKHLDGGICAERTPTAPWRGNHYGRAKLEAENLVRAECERAGCSWSIVRLDCTVYGPGLSPLVKNFVPLAERGRICVIGDGGNRFALLYVDDAARAVLLAGTQAAAAGKVYDVAGDAPITQRRFLEVTAESLGVPGPRRRIGFRSAYLGAALADLWAWVRGRQPPFTRSLVSLMVADQEVDSGRIRSELGWRPEVSVEEGMRRMGRWYRIVRRSRLVRLALRRAGPMPDRLSLDRQAGTCW